MIVAKLMWYKRNTTLRVLIYTKIINFNRDFTSSHQTVGHYFTVAAWHTVCFVKYKKIKHHTHRSCTMKSVLSGEIWPVTGCRNAVVLWLWLSEKRQITIRNNTRGETTWAMHHYSFVRRGHAFYRNTPRERMSFPARCRMWNGPEAKTRLTLEHTVCRAQH